MSPNQSSNKKKATKALKSGHQNNQAVLRHYTSLSSLIHMLQQKKITLRSPENWDDKNDVYVLQRYKEKKDLQYLFAICFTAQKRTYHHWRVFAQGTDGVCISFNKSELLEKIAKKGKCFRSGEVVYHSFNRAKNNLKLDDLPFWKTLPYKAEAEYRIIYENKEKPLEQPFIKFDISCIGSVTLSPWLAKPLRNSVEKALRSIEDCTDLRILQSTVTRSSNLLKVVDEILKADTPSK